MVDLPAGLPSMAHLHHRAAQREAVAKADVLLRHPARRDILAKGARLLQQGMARLALAPPAIMVLRVEVDRLVPAAVMHAVGHAVAFQAQPADPHRARQIGRASCRERVCQYVSISVVAVSLKKKTNSIKMNDITTT